eukprot:3749692-Rhodomonas_salina.2
MSRLLHARIFSVRCKQPHTPLETLTQRAAAANRASSRRRSRRFASVYGCFAAVYASIAALYACTTSRYGSISAIYDRIA